MTPVLTSSATVKALEALQDGILALPHGTEQQGWLRSQALQLSGAILETRWKLIENSTNRAPAALQTLVGCWFVVIFASFGLFAPRNLTAVTMILLCALAVGMAIRLTAELGAPFGGLIRVTGAPLLQALDLIAQ